MPAPVYRSAAAVQTLSTRSQHQAGVNQGLVLQDKRDGLQLKGANSVQLHDQRFSTAQTSAAGTLGKSSPSEFGSATSMLGEPSGLLEQTALTQFAHAPAISSATTLAGTAPLQFKSLGQAKLDAGLTDAGELALNNPVSGPIKGKLYTKDAAQADDKPQALKQAAMIAGDLGQATQDDVFLNKNSASATTRDALTKARVPVSKAIKVALAGQEDGKATAQHIKDAAAAAKADTFLAEVGTPNNIIALSYDEVYQATYQAPHVAGGQGHYQAEFKAGYKDYVKGKVSSKVADASLAAQDKLTFLDPLTLRVAATYGKADGKLELDYQFAFDWPGYIVKIKHEGGDGEAFDASMEHRGHLGAAAGKGIPATFSNKHDTSNAAALSSLLDTDANATQTNNEIAIDAHARIAGEGARWVAVRDHAAAIKNGTRFYAIKTGQDAAVADKVVRYIDFNSLWLSWDTMFNKKYNISNASFSSKLTESKLGDEKWKGQGLKEDKQVSDMTADDVKVD